MVLPCFRVKLVQCTFHLMLAATFHHCPKCAVFSATSENYLIVEIVEMCLCFLLIALTVTYKLICLVGFWFLTRLRKVLMNFEIS